METQNTINGIFTRANVFKECALLVFNVVFFSLWGYSFMSVFSSMNIRNSRDTLFNLKKQWHDFYRCQKTYPSMYYFVRGKYTFVCERVLSEVSTHSCECTKKASPLRLCILMDFFRRRKTFIFFRTENSIFII